MSGAPMTLEGWYALHDFYAVDWPRWNALAVADQEAILLEATTLLERQTHPSDGHSACWTLLTQKGDLAFLHWRRQLEALRCEETALSRTRLRAYLRPTYSYLSVIELGTYELAGHAAAMLERKGIRAGSPGYDDALKGELERLARPRLFPEVPPGGYVCFYPMSKRRGEQVNWFDLPAEERAPTSCAEPSHPADGRHSAQRTSCRRKRCGKPLSATRPRFEKAKPLPAASCRTTSATRIWSGRARSVIRAAAWTALPKRSCP